MPKYETQNTFYRMVLVPRFGNEIGPAYVILQKKTFYQKIILKKRPGNEFQVIFDFKRVLCKKESEEVCMLIWKNFDSFAGTI